MGWLTRWRRSQAENELERSPNALDRLEKLERDALAHAAHIEKLQLDKPAFIAALEEMAERCHDILDQSEAKRARVDAAENRRKRREAAPEPDQVQGFPDRASELANVRRLLRMQGKI